MKGYSPPPPPPQPRPAPVKGYSPPPPPVKGPPPPPPAPVKGRPAPQPRPQPRPIPQQPVKGYSSAKLQSPPVSTTTIVYDERATYTSPLESSTPASLRVEEETPGQPNSDIGFDDESTAFSEDDMPSKMPLEELEDVEPVEVGREVESNDNSAPSSHLNAPIRGRYTNSNYSASLTRDTYDDNDKPRTVPPIRNLPLSPVNKLRKAQRDDDNGSSGGSSGRLSTEVEDTETFDNQPVDGPFETTVAPSGRLRRPTASYSSSYSNSGSNSRRPSASPLTATSASPAFGERIRTTARSRDLSEYASSSRETSVPVDDNDSINDDEVSNHDNTNGHDTSNYNGNEEYNNNGDGTDAASGDLAERGSEKGEIIEYMDEAEESVAGNEDAVDIENKNRRVSTSVSASSTRTSPSPQMTSSTSSVSSSSANSYSSPLPAASTKPSKLVKTSSSTSRVSA